MNEFPTAPSYTRLLTAACASFALQVLVYPCGEHVHAAGLRPLCAINTRDLPPCHIAHNLLDGDDRRPLLHMFLSAVASYINQAPALAA